MERIFHDTDVICTYKIMFSKADLNKVDNLFTMREIKLDVFKEFHRNNIIPYLEGKLAENIVQERFSAFMEVNMTYLLNEIEYFSMCFLSVANQRKVFKSIHQTFLRYIRLSYCKICEWNKKGQIQYYPHTIRLYNKWNKRSKSIVKRRC